MTTTKHARHVINDATRAQLEARGISMSRILIPPPLRATKPHKAEKPRTQPRNSYSVSSIPRYWYTCSRLTSYNMTVLPQSNGRGGENLAGPSCPRCDGDHRKDVFRPPPKHADAPLKCPGLRI